MPSESPRPEENTRTSERIWLTPWERAALWGLLAFVLAFGGVVEMRSAFLKRRMTDADCFFRAAWAVRSGIDLYSVTETNGWHYNYPPLLAIMMAPLASPPPGSDETGMLPYAISVAIWYALSIGCLWGAVHWLAGALERAGPERWKLARYSRAWWAIRIVPILLVSMDIGRTLSRGQSNMILLLLFCGAIALLIRGRRFLAGLCLAGTICIKVFPVFLLIHPILRRDFRCLAGVGAGLLIGLVLIPVAVMGPDRALESHRRFDQVVVRPGLRIGTDTTRENDLTQASSTGSQSFMVILHNYLFPDRQTRPKENSPAVRTLHWIIGAILTAGTLAAGLRPRPVDAISRIIYLGALVVIMLPVSPVCHAHYFIFALPLVLGLVADAWERHPFPSLGPTLTILFSITAAANILASMPFTNQWLRDFGLPLYATLALWLAGIVTLRKRATREPSRV